MKVSVPQNSVGKLVHWSRNVLLTAAAGLLGYCGFVLADAWIYQREASQLFDRARLQVAAIPSPGTEATNGLLGRMEIPRLGVSLIVAEGTAEATLRRAGGHIPGTSLPGQRGNVGIAGHRDTLFRPLRNIRQNDVITLTTLAGDYRYRVTSTEIVSPSDVTVLQSDGDEVLTLVTCYPFYFVGPAPDRFIVRAQRVIGST
ncbi:MAG TPA: class D sortase [Bryobacteraceae bacterium]|nr:class D sortase [Bryobacteraceae bacterium]